jgi:prepilin-type N-terminal cleavage/methylation domain-containing protein
MMAPGLRRGFTLVELLVALVIAGLVAMVVFAGLAVASEAHARRAAAAAPVLGEHAALAALEAWMRAASVSVAPFVGTDRRFGDLERDELSLGVTDGGFLHPGPGRLRLWADPGGAGIRAELVGRGGLDGAVTPLLLVPGAVGLSLRYRTRVGGRDVWLDQWESDLHLPSAIRVVFVVDTAAAGPAPSLYRLPRVVPVGWGVQ